MEQDRKVLAYWWGATRHAFLNASFAISLASLILMFTCCRYSYVTVTLYTIQMSMWHREKTTELFPFYCHKYTELTKNATHEIRKGVMWDLYTMTCRRPITAEFRIPSPATQCEIYDGKIGIGTWLPPSCHIPVTFHTNSSPYTFTVVPYQYHSTDTVAHTHSQLSHTSTIPQTQ